MFKNLNRKSNLQLQAVEIDAHCEAPEDCPLKKSGAALSSIGASIGAVTLDQLSPGRSAVVKKLSPQQPRLCCKLHAMGIVEGQEVSVKQQAPFGDPISISTLGYTLSLRLSEAKAIEVIPS